jgi:hypothetical protein
MSIQGCGCSGCSRREFLTAAGATVGLMATTAISANSGLDKTVRVKEGAKVRAVFLYPPSSTFRDNPNGWWSWPGNEYDAEGRQKQYTQVINKISKKLGMAVSITGEPVGSDRQVQQLAAQLSSEKPAGLLLMMFYNNSLAHADILLKAAEKAKIPVIFYIGLGVKHGSVDRYRREGVYFIQSLDNFDAIEYGLRMINTKKVMSQSRLLSITEAKEPREGVERFFKTTVRVIPFTQYAEVFEKISIGKKQRDWIRGITGQATEIRGITDASLENAARAHFALLDLLDRHQADGLTMNCLRRGMLKPCISFSQLNGQLIPATCENDFSAMYTQLLGQQLTGRPGFQHNPCFDTERNHYYASHCTCAPKLHGPDSKALPYLLRRFAHTNEGSCAIQVFWQPDTPVTMMRYYPGDTPSLGIYAGKVVASHPMPPAAGCTTNVEIAVRNCPDVCKVTGHHNLLFAGDYDRIFKLFARLYRMGPGTEA